MEREKTVEPTRKCEESHEKGGFACPEVLECGFRIDS